MPEHHTDLEFSRTLLSVKDRVMIKAAGVTWEKDLSLGDSVRELDIPWDLVERESHDGGSYIVALRLPRDRKIAVGALGAVKFRKGFYLYVGSAMKDLTQRIARHQRLTKRMHWHIDYLREHADYIAGIPIRTSADIECEVAGALSGIAEWQVPGFGCSDCGCPTHLVGMAEDPFLKRPFSDLLLRFRMGLLEEELSSRSFTRR